jgi:hypothetical protein
MPQAALPPAPAAVTGDPVDELFTNLNAETGEEIPPEPRALQSWQRDDTYDGIAALLLSDAQVSTLTAPVTDEEIDIKPDSFGAVYLSHAVYRKRLNAAFRPGGWAQRQIGEWKYDPDTKILTAEFALYARGEDGKVCYVSKAIGAQKYYGGTGDSDMSYDDAAQAVESSALTRNCKQLGIAIELWEKRTATAIRNRLGVFVKYKKGNDVKVAWRRIDDAPLRNEFGIANESPNKEAYQARQQAAPATSSASAPNPQPTATTAKAPATATQPAAAPAQPATATAPEWGKNGIISEPQARRLFAITKKSGVTEQAVGQYLKTKYGYTSSKQITKANYEAIVKWIEGGGD